MSQDKRKLQRSERSWQRSRWFDRLGHWLRQGWRLYLAVLALLLGAVITSGPNLYPFQLAQSYPVLWIVYGVFTLGALGGLVLIIRDWRMKHPVTQRVQYLNAVQKNYHVIPLVIDAETAKVAEFSSEVYQTLRYLNTPQRPDDESKATAATTATVKIRTIFDFFEQYNRATETIRTLVILGTPGGGKTTLLRQSMVKYADNALRSSTPAPIFLRLPDFARYLGEDEPHALQNYLKDQPELEGITSFAEELEQRALSGETYLFLDGLDEVAHQPREKVKAWMKRIQQALIDRNSPYSALVVSTRFTVYSPGEDLLPQKTELVAQKMDATERATLATALFPALYTQMQRDNPTAYAHLAARYPDPKAFATAFVTAIEDHPQHDLLGGNPLLFSLSAYVYVNDSGELPASRVMLYRRYITTFLAKVVKIRLDSERETLKNFETEGVLDEVVTTLAGVSRYLFEQSTLNPVIATDTSGITALTAAREFVRADIMDALERLRLDQNWQYSPAQMITWVLESGLIATINQALQRYQFQHQTYQEYLTAVALADDVVSPRPAVSERAWATLHQFRFDPRWTEPMSMFTGALVAKNRPQARQAARKWVQELQGIAIDAANATHEDALYLAVISFADVPDFATFGQEVAATTLLDLWAQALLRFATEATSTRLDQFQRASEKVALLPPQFTEGAIARLQSALGDDAQPEQQIAASLAIEGMGNLVTDLEPLTRVLEKGSDEQARIKAARALAKLKRSDANANPPEFFPGHPRLQSALVGEDAAIATIIAQALIECGRDAEPLIDTAIHAENATIRNWGAIALGSIATEDARQKLKALQRDPVAQVANTAYQVFGRLQETVVPLSLADLQRIASEGINVSSTLRDYLPASLRQLGYESRLLNGVVVITAPVIRIAAGPFLMGSDTREDKQADDDETPEHTIQLNDYAIAKYPLTVAEYACAVGQAFQGQAIAEPPINRVSWQQQLQNSDHPVVNISWNDAVQYTQWLAEMTGQQWRLPTEAEWEKAARWDVEKQVARIYPYGDNFDASKANTYESKVNTTTPVGSYPQGASPYGLLDCSGNVLEWTSSIFKPYPYQANDGRENLTATDNRVLRGGSWFSYSRDARAACRVDSSIDGRTSVVGVRLAVSSAG